MKEEIIEKAYQILARSPGAVVSYRLHRDVIKLSPGDTELQRAKKHLKDSRNISELESEQRKDGGWGAFHSRSTKHKQKIPSTEVGVERALALGLTRSHPVLTNTADYILNIMEGKLSFPDYHEKNDRWPTGMRLFLASTLSLIVPEHPALDRDRELWHVIAMRAFQSGEYNEEDEISAHAELTGASVKDSYLVLNNRYQLNILGSQPGTISRELEVALLQWVWRRPDGIGYLEIPLNRKPTEKPGHLDRWLASLELLARAFPSWVRFAGASIEWLWDQQNEQGLWDFGPRPGSISNLPLSDNWRRKYNRVFDWSTRVLLLLRKYRDDKQ
jgi:hypothetical protein